MSPIASAHEFPNVFLSNKSSKFLGRLHESMTNASHTVNVVFSDTLKAAETAKVAGALTSLHGDVVATDHAQAAKVPLLDGAALTFTIAHKGHVASTPRLRNEIPDSHTALSQLRISPASSERRAVLASLGVVQTVLRVLQRKLAFIEIIDAGKQASSLRAQLGEQRYTLSLAVHDKRDQRATRTAPLLTDSRPPEGGSPTSGRLSRRSSADSFKSIESFPSDRSFVFVHDPDDVSLARTSSGDSHRSSEFELVD